MRLIMAIITLYSFSALSAPPCTQKAIKATLSIANMNSAPTNPMRFSSLTPLSKKAAEGQSVFYTYKVTAKDDKTDAYDEYITRMRKLVDGTCLVNNIRFFRMD